MNNTTATILLEHYKIIKQEISQNTADSLKALELGIIVVSALFTLASAEVISEDIRWLFFLFPAMVVSPFIFFIAQRFSHTRKIGTYIGRKLEPTLGFDWDGLHQKTVPKGKRWTLRSVMATSLPLAIMQILSWAASLYYLLSSLGAPEGNPTVKMTIWICATAILISLLVLEFRSIREALTKDFFKEME